MNDIPMYHDGSRQLQDQFATRKLADRLVEVLARDAFSDEDRVFIGFPRPGTASMNYLCRQAKKVATFFAFVQNPA